MHTLVNKDILQSAILKQLLLTTCDNDILTRDETDTYAMIDDFLEMHSNGAAVNIRMGVAGVDQNADFLRSDLGRSISKHKQHGVDDIWLAAAVRTNNWGKILQQQQQQQQKY